MPFRHCCVNFVKRVAPDRGKRDLQSSLSRRSVLVARVIAALTWVAGTGSLALFGAFLWSENLMGLHLRLADHSLLLWDSSLCLLFFAQHSVMVRRSVRNQLRRVIPEHCQGVAYTFTSATALV